MINKSVVEEDLRYKFFYEGKLALAYNKGSLEWGDTYLSRPNFYPVYTPCGREVTTISSYFRTHHKSIFFGHADVDGINFYHDNNPTMPNLGDIVFEGGKVSESEGSITIRTSNGWVTKKGLRKLSERRDITWIPGTKVHILDISSTLVSASADVTFAKDIHSYIGVRMADTIDVEDGGRAVNSNGEENESGTMDKYADWVDYSGMVADHQVGITLMHHPYNPPSPYFVRDYGTMCSNFTLHQPYVLMAGVELSLRFRLLIHSGGPDEIGITGYHAAYATSTSSM